MYKIGISGKANSGKNTLGKLLLKELRKTKSGLFCQYISFADPIKKMIRTMFPDLPEKYLTGPSKYRSEIIPGAFKNGQPLTVRELLRELGTDIGRQYKEDIWLNAFDHSFQQAKNKNVVICEDVRFVNEFDHLKKKDFFIIRLLRNSHLKSDHASETNQDIIKDNEFDYVVHNNGTMKDLKQVASQIINIIR